MYRIMRLRFSFFSLFPSFPLFLFSSFPLFLFSSFPLFLFSSFLFFVRFPLEITLSNKLYPNRTQIRRQLAKISLLRTQLQKKREESQGRNNNSIDGVPVRLFIAEEPFPFVFPQKHQLHADELQVEVLYAETGVIDKMGPVSVLLVADARQIAEAEKDPLGGDVQEVDMHTSTARFPLTFNYGTRKETIRLRFSLNIAYRVMISSFLFPFFPSFHLPFSHFPPLPYRITLI